jgi:hypothetical protein
MGMNLKTITSCLGYQQITDVSGSTALTVPTRDANGSLQKPVLAIIIAQTQAVRWRDDGVAPSATVGMPLAVGVSFIYDGDLTKIRFFEQAASAALNVSYYA